mmetsp:Transcript_80249/g.208547  ORF Transcript_80249/g.208547 Transcript_80249/m.208547 type:complete len:230 (-) Transcript_80249:2567-3256(-)
MTNRCEPPIRLTTASVISPPELWITSLSLRKSIAPVSASSLKVYSPILVISTVPFHLAAKLPLYLSSSPVHGSATCCQAISCSARTTSGFLPKSGGGLEPRIPSAKEKYSAYRHESRFSLSTARCGELTARNVVKEMRSISIELVSPDNANLTILRPPPFGSDTFHVPAAPRPWLFKVNMPSALSVISSSVSLPLGFHCHTATNSSIMSALSLGRTKCAGTLRSFPPCA